MFNSLAEPISELHKAHEQFILRMESYKRRKDKLQERIPTKADPSPKMPAKAGPSATSMNQVEGESRNSKQLKSNSTQKSGSRSTSLGCYPPLGPAKVCMLSRGNSGANNNLSRCNSDDTVVVKFVGSALVGKSEAEDACHHGLVEPTINTKEAMDAINSMFLEPVEPETTLKRRSKHEKTNSNQQKSAFDIFVDEDEPKYNDPKMVHSNSMKQEHPKFGQQTRGFEIFIDEDSTNGKNQNTGQNKNSKKENMKSNQETSGFEIFVDENEANCNVQNVMCHKNNRCPPRPLHDSSRHKGQNDFQKPFVGGFAILPDEEEEQCEKSDDDVKTNSRTVQPTHDNNSLHCRVQADSGTRYHERPRPASSGLQEDTVIHRFVGSTIDDEAKVENACHHGLVDPTVNLKEAMDAINNMFGKPLNFQGERTKRKTNTLSDRKAAPVSGFSILADDDPKESTCKASQSNSCKFGDENGLFEPTITTRDVMAEINDMFGMPLD